MTARLSNPRQIAFHILLEVETGAHASDLLAAHTASLDSRDAGLATAIVLGVLRYRAQIDWIIAQLSGRAPAKLDSEVLTALRMGVYQLRYLDRVPEHAAVNASVELVKRARKRSAAGFVNAVLRKVTRDPIAWPDRATELSCPEWLLERWGPDAETIARAALETPQLYTRGGIAMDIGSQSIVPLLDLAPGMTFLDVCAAPGNKTAQALETPLRAIACDASFKRLAPLVRLAIPLVVADARAPLPFSRRFDRILVDAPCSGTGTLAHNPEIKWRLTPADIDRHAARQAAILRNALDRLAPGGVLVYSTCSLEPEENERVVAMFDPVRTMRRIPGRDPGDGFFAAIMVGQPFLPAAGLRPGVPRAGNALPRTIRRDGDPAPVIPWEES